MSTYVPSAVVKAPKKTTLVVYSSMKPGNEPILTIPGDKTIGDTRAVIRQHLEKRLNRLAEDGGMKITHITYRVEEVDDTTNKVAGETIEDYFFLVQAVLGEFHAHQTEWRTRMRTVVVPHVE